MTIKHNLSHYDPQNTCQLLWSYWFSFHGENWKTIPYVHICPSYSHDYPLFLSHDPHDIPSYFHHYSHIVRFISIDQSSKYQKKMCVCVFNDRITYLLKNCVCSQYTIIIFLYVFKSYSHNTFPPVTPTGHLLPGEAVQQAILPTAQEHGHEDLPGRPRKGLGFGTCTWYVSWYNVIWW